MNLVNQAVVHKIFGEGTVIAHNGDYITIKFAKAEKKFISPTINLENPDDDFAWADLVRECRTGVEIRHAISNSFAFGGSNCAVVISQPENI